MSRRIYMTIVAGAAVGILGITSWGGLAAYLISQALVSRSVLAGVNASRGGRVGMVDGSSGSECASGIRNDMLVRALGGMG